MSRVRKRSQEPTSSTTASSVSTDEGPAVKASTGIRGTCTYGDRSITHCGS